MIGVINMEQISSTQNVKMQVKMEEPVITQQLGMDLQLVVDLQNIQIMILQVGANNYFLFRYMAALQHTISR